jgi:tRNA nucleotidyltransferase (CCA-adding enzyme)
MRLIHNVYFTLKDRSDGAIANLIAACKKYLTKQPGIEFFAAGTLAKDLVRQVNDRDWDVALHLVFATSEHQEAYQVDVMHQQFIAENNSNWAKVRVFDSLID